jgi:hypothetical protein
MDFNDPNYKAWLIQKILSGQYDYTYGPGSPGATPSDMNQKIGAFNNPLKTGNIALPQRDYELFTPEERQQYGIADTSWIKPGQPTSGGSVERYFGPDASGYSGLPAYAQVPQSNSYSPAATSVSNYGQMGTWANYYNPQPSTTDQVSSGIGKGLQSYSQSMMQQGQSGTNQALAMLQRPQQNNALAQEAANPFAALMQLYQLIGIM